MMANKGKLVREVMGSCDFVTEEQAQTIIVFIITELIDGIDNLNDFVKNKLIIFNKKKRAFDWLFDYEREGAIAKEHVDIVITEDMLGRNLRDIMLESQENYEEVA